MNLIFATNNSNKLKEIRALLGPGFGISGLDERGITDDIPEDFATLEENALFKANYIHKITGSGVFADDTGLEVFALGGQPGVHSARFAGPQRDFSANIDKVLQMLHGNLDRRARFRTVIALIYEGKTQLFEGIAEGKIIEVRRGSEGFGYDPVFIPDGYSKTFAEMNLTEKNLVSHRAKAFKKLTDFLRA
jgi:XTP/dITP diphosphohydrolase